MSEETTSVGWYRRRGLRRAAWIAGGALLLLAAGAIALPGFVDWNRYRGEIAAMAERATGRAVTIGGNISFTLLPAPALRVGELGIANLADAEAESFAKLEHLDVVVELLPLFAGDLHLRRLVLNGPVITFERLSDGRVNWHFPALDRKAGDRREIRLQRFEIRDGLLRFIDHAAGRRYALEAVDARLAADTLAGPYRLSAKAAFAGADLVFALRTNRFEGGRRTPVSAEIDVAGSRARYNGWLRLTKAGLPQSAGAIDVEGESLAALLETVARGVDPAPQEASFPSAVDAPFSLRGQLETGTAIALDDIAARLGEAALTGRAALTPGERPFLDLALRADGVDLDAAIAGDRSGGDAWPQPRIPELPLPFDFALTLEAAPLSFRGEIVNRVALKARGGRETLVLEKLDATLPGASTGSLTGEIAATQTGPRLTGRAGLSAGDLRRLLDWLGLSLPQQVGGFGSGRIETTLAADREAIHLTEIDASVDATKAGGELTLSAIGETPRIETSLTIDRLDLDRYLPQPTPAAERGGDRSPGERLKTVLEKLPSLNGRAHIVLDRLRAAGTWMNGVSLRIAMAEDALTVEEAQVRNVFGASAGISGRLEEPADAAPGELRADILLRADIPEIEPVARWLGIALPDSLSPQALAPLAIEGRAVAGRRSLELDFSGRVAGGRATLGGRIDRPFAAERGAMDLALEYDHPSHRALAERFALPALSRASPLPLHLALAVEGEAPRLSLTAEIEALGGEATFVGEREQTAEGAALVGALRGAHSDLRQLIRHFLPAYAPRQARLGGLTLKSQVRASAKALLLTKLTADLGPAALGGEIAIRRGAARPRVEARLEGGVLPLAAFLPAAQEPGSRWPTGVVDVSPLEAVDGRLRLTATALHLPPYRVRDLALEAALEAGRLRLGSLTGRLFGGDLRIAGRMDARPVLPTLSLSLALRGGDAAQALAAAIGRSPLAGRFDLQGGFAARGNSPFGLINTLSGEATLAIRDGSLAGFDLSRLSTGIAGARSLEAAALIETALSGGETLLERLNARITVRNGIFAAPSIKAQLGSGEMTLGTEIDLAGWSIASSGQIRLAAYPQAPPIAIEIGGPLDAPNGALEPGALRLWLMQRLAPTAYAPIPVSRSLLEAPPALPDVVGPAEAISEMPADDSPGDGTANDSAPNDRSP